MRVLNLLTSGNVGGIEVLCKDIAEYSKIENVFCFLFGEGTIFEEMHSLGYEVHSLDCGGVISLTRYKKLKSIARDCGIIVVHHDDPFLEMYYLVLMHSFPSKKFISMVHHCYDPIADNLGYGLAKRIIKKSIISEMFTKSDGLIFVSKNGYQSYVQDYKINKDKVKIVYNGINPQKIEKGKLSNKINNNIIKFSYVGRLVELKGVDILIDAFSQIDSNCTLTIVGDGPCREHLENQVKDEVKDRVNFCGFQRNVIQYLTDSDIFVYPSKTEIFGLSIVEAMAFGNICVANNVGGIPEIIKDGYNGFLNMNNTLDGLVSAMNKAINVVRNEEMRKKIEIRAKETAEYFSIERTISELEKIYIEMVV